MKNIVPHDVCPDMFFSNTKILIKYQIKCLIFYHYSLDNFHILNFNDLFKYLVVMRLPKIDLNLINVRDIS